MCSYQNCLVKSKLKSCRNCSYHCSQKPIVDESLRKVWSNFYLLLNVHFNFMKGLIFFKSNGVSMWRTVIWHICTAANAHAHTHPHTDNLKYPLSPGCILNVHCIFLKRSTTHIFITNHAPKTSYPYISCLENYWKISVNFVCLIFQWILH